MARQRVIPKPDTSSLYKVGVKSDKQLPQKPQVEEELNMADCPLPEDNFKDWLKF